MSKMAEPTDRSPEPAASAELRTEGRRGGEDLAGRPRRNDRGILVAIAIAAMLPMIHYAWTARIEYDGWMHLLIARDDDWRAMARQIAINAHPPLYYLLLKLVSVFGSHPLVYRSLSILSAGVGVVAIGAALRQVSRTRSAPILCALAFGLATSTAVIASEIRSYMLATAFLLLALPPYLALVRPGGDLRARVGFVVFSALAFLTHYGTLLVLIALLAAPVMLAAVSRDQRRAWRRAWPSRWRSDLLTLLPLFVLVATLYAGHIARHATSMNHLPDFYYSGSEPLWQYVGRGLARQVALFAPLPFPDKTWAPGLALAVTAASIVLLLVMLGRERERSSAAVLPLTLLALTALQLAGSVAGRYPFGGALRHQYFFLPIGLATLFLLVDRLLARVSRPVWRGAAASLAAAVALWSAHQQWSRLPRPTEQLFGVEFAVFQSEISVADAVYLDGFNLYAMFGQLQDWKWSSHGFSEDGSFRILRVSRSSEGFFVLQDRKHWNAPLDQPRFYRDLREALQSLGLSSLAIFHLSQEGMSQTVRGLAEAGAETESMVAAAGRGGMDPGTIVRSGSNVFARLTVPRPGAGAAELRAEHTVVEPGRIGALPNPIQVCDEPALGATTIWWTFPGRTIDIRLGSPDGTLWATRTGSGSARTGEWVHDDMTIYVQDRSAGRPTSEESTLATLVVDHTDRGCPGAGRSLGDGHR